MRLWRRGKSAIAGRSKKVWFGLVGFEWVFQGKKKGGREAAEKPPETESLKQKQFNQHKRMDWQSKSTRAPKERKEEKRRRRDRRRRERQTGFVGSAPLVAFYSPSQSVVAPALRSTMLCAVEEVLTDTLDVLLRRFQSIACPSLSGSSTIYPVGSPNHVVSDRRWT